jgi:hypothetical protein
LKQSPTGRIGLTVAFKGFWKKCAISE